MDGPFSNEQNLRSDLSYVDPDIHRTEESLRDLCASDGFAFHKQLSNAGELLVSAKGF